MDIGKMTARRPCIVARAQQLTKTSRVALRSDKFQDEKYILDGYGRTDPNHDATL
jgi:hypothetical protein